MTKLNSSSASEAQVRALAEFRTTLRRFLHFSEEAATRAGLTPQQHQLLLQIAGAPADAITTVGYLAYKLVLRHHSVVELTNRCEAAGLVVRRRDPGNRRQVMLELTSAGNRILRELSAGHAQELTELGPTLIDALQDCIAAGPVKDAGGSIGELP